MPKILYFITQSEFGGAQRYVFDLAMGLKPEFEVAVALGEQGNNGILAKNLQENNIKYFIISHLKRDISPFNEILTFFEIRKLLKSYKPDVIHLNSSKISILGSLAAAGCKTKVIYTAHGWVFNEPLPAPVKWFYKFAEKFTARFKNKIICVSEFDRQSALKNKITPAKKLVTIHNGLAFSHSGLDPESSVKKLEQISGSRIKSEMTNGVLIGSIGNLYKTKGYEYFIEAASMIKSPATFVVIGEGSERKNLEKLIAKYDLKNKFILAGKIDDAARLLKAFDLYVCSSVKEGLPYSIIEAMQAGLPIVSTRVGGIPEMIANHKTGLTCKPADAKDLAEKINFLLDNKALAESLAQNAKLRAKSEFGLEKMVEETKKIYK